MFLFNVNLTIFAVVTVWVGLCVILYACLTFLPIVYKNSPWSMFRTAFCMGLFLSHRHATCFLEKLHRNRSSAARPVHLFSHSMRETAEDSALKVHRNIDFRALFWAFKSLDEDGELQHF